MKSIVRACALALALTSVSTASAQGFVLVDAAKNSFGTEGGAVYGKNLLGGFSAGVFHPYAFEKTAIDVEAYGILGTTIGSDWVFLANLGGGVASDENGTVGSARSIFVLMQTLPVAFRTQLFSMWTPVQGSVFMQERTGPSFRLGDTGFRLFPHLALNVSFTSSSRAIEKSVSPGCVLFASF